MVRRMENKDIEQIAQLEIECFTKSAAWSENSLKKYVEDKDSVFCVCEIDGEIVGYAGMYYVYPEGDITNVAIKATHRRKGYARAILLRMLEESEKAGIEEYTLEVRKSNAAAIKLYSGLGFKTEGIRKNFYDNPKEDALIMWRRQNDSE